MPKTLDDQMKAYYQASQKRESGDMGEQRMFDIIGGVFDLMAEKINEQEKRIAQLEKEIKILFDRQP